MDTALKSVFNDVLDMPRLNVDFFVPELTEYYRKKDAVSAEVVQEAKPLSYEEEILRYATVRLW
jgi:hypothetical protein